VNTLHDVIFGGAPDGQPDGDEEFTYGLLCASLDESDARLMTQLRTTTRKKLAFKHLRNLTFEKSIVPFASDENPLGDYRAHAVAIVCEDRSWGPDFISSAAEEINYSQIIDAAQDVAEYVVFFFIKHHLESRDYDGVVHPKFMKAAKGPWPSPTPHVFVMSIYEQFNPAQIDVIRTCMNTTNDLQMKMEIKKHLAKARDYLEAKQAKDKLVEILAAPLPLQHVESKSDDKDVKEKERDHEDASSLDIQAIRRQILTENQQLWIEVKSQLRGMQDEINNLKKALKAKDDQIVELSKKAVKLEKGEPAPVTKVEPLVPTSL